MICVKNGIIHNGIEPKSFVADILIETGRHLAKIPRPTMELKIILHV